MKTKYVNIPSPILSEYKDSLINRIWVLLPLREENCPTIKENVERLNRELSGLLKMGSEQNKYIITIMSLLENSLSETDFKKYRSDILRCCELTKKIDNGGDEDV